jgi:hypothetical protein
MGRNMKSEDANPRNEMYIAKTKFQRNGIISRPFGTWAAFGGFFNAGMNPCVEISRPFGTKTEFVHQTKKR